MAVMFIPIALIGPVFYAFEGNYVVKLGGLDPVQALLDASLIGSAIGLDWIGSGAGFGPVY
jgi:hypothetical protein